VINRREVATTSAAEKALGSSSLDLSDARQGRPRNEIDADAAADLG